MNQRPEDSSIWSNNPFSKLKRETQTTAHQGILPCNITNLLRAFQLGSLRQSEMSVYGWKIVYHTFLYIHMCKIFVFIYFMLSWKFLHTNFNMIVTLYNAFTFNDWAFSLFLFPFLVLFSFGVLCAAAYFYHHPLHNIVLLLMLFPDVT